MDGYLSMVLYPKFFPGEGKKKKFKIRNYTIFLQNKSGKEIEKGGRKKFNKVGILVKITLLRLSH